ncbi:hypothetical protein HY994_05340 [Candidatus Micrarchaeota archaeon]|nr:hypothetical protein [Candidatus Micrarchaeota archaeon]
MMPKLSAFSSSSSDIKDLVISILSKDEHLSAKSVFQAIQKDYGSKITYQGVHKALRSMVLQGILETEANKYFVNSKWLSEMSAFVSKMDATRSGKSALDFGDIKNDTSVTLTFNSYLESLYALLDNMDRDVKLGQVGDVTVAHWYHAWPVTCISKKEFDQLNRVMRVGQRYVLGNQSSPLDQVLCDLWRGFDAKIQLGVPCATTCDLLVTGDKIVQIYLSPPVRKGIHDVYRSSTKGKIDFSSLYSCIFGLKGNVKVIITQNKDLADEIRAETMEYFK